MPEQHMERSQFRLGDASNEQIANKEALTLPENKFFEGARNVAQNLRDSGYEAYLAGGCVRDMVLGVEPKDFDMTTNALPEQVAKLFPRTVMQAAEYGMVRVLLNGDCYEVSTYRGDGGAFSSTKEEDVARRDFTMNALLIDPLTKEVIDLVGGMDDIKAGIIRATNDPTKAGDALWLIRAIRFACQFDFDIDPSLYDAIKTHHDNALTLKQERSTNEIRKMLATSMPLHGLQLMKECGLLPLLLPWLDINPEMKEQLTRLESTSDAPAMTTWAIIMADQEVTTLGKTIKLSNKEITDINDIVKNIEALSSLDEIALRRLAVKNNQQAILALAKVRFGTGSPETIGFQKIIEDLQTNPLPKLPLITGTDLHSLGIKPGPKFKEILEQVETLALSRSLSTKEEAMKYVQSLQ
ncbi:MAG: CCA tRNA nucleotidyltransferase [bacterium]|nr:CCA tRNA nucleotidyltransferase [bacterium]